MTSDYVFDLPVYMIFFDNECMKDHKADVCLKIKSFVKDLNMMLLLCRDHVGLDNRPIY